ncbi:MAG: class II aldolase/adducin family protein [Elusimicrobiales bacterium]|nr:class II aldolase/adducin family protein [Elusimicrobiales bacterium]
MSEENKKIFISDWELKKIVESGKPIPANAIISPLSKEWLDYNSNKENSENNISESDLRNQIVNIGIRLYALGFVPATDGNISARLTTSSFLITPSGMPKGNINPDDISKITMDGQVISGKKPSSEYLLHSTIYKERPDIMAIVHAHPPIATAFACCGRDLSEPLTSELVITLGKIPLAEYATPGTNEVSASIIPFVKRHNALLLANHGAVAYGKNLEQAFQRMETVEHFAKISLNAETLGDKKVIGSSKVTELEAIRKKLGL